MLGAVLLGAALLGAARCSQLVTCTLTTPELQASARAELVSACSAKDMESELLRFEQRVTQGLQRVHSSIARVEDKLARLADLFHEPGPRRTENLADVVGDAPARYATGSTREARVLEHVWKVAGPVHDTLRSPSFYLWPRGYRMYLRLRAHGEGRDVSVHAGLTRGDYDHALAWPFALRHRLKVARATSRLCDPARLCGSLPWQRPGAGDNPGCAVLAFSHRALQHGVVVRLELLLE